QGLLLLAGAVLVGVQSNQKADGHGGGLKRLGADLSRPTLMRLVARLHDGAGQLAKLLPEDGHGVQRVRRPGRELAQRSEQLTEHGVDYGVDADGAHAAPAFALSAAMSCSASATPRALSATVVGNAGSSSVTSPASSSRLTVRRVNAWYCTGPRWRMVLSYAM